MCQKTLGQCSVYLSVCMLLIFRANGSKVLVLSSLPSVGPTGTANDSFIYPI